MIREWRTLLDFNISEKASRRGRYVCTVTSFERNLHKVILYACSEERQCGWDTAHFSRNARPSTRTSGGRGTEKPKIEEKRTNLVLWTVGTQPMVVIGTFVKPEAGEMKPIAAPLTTKQLPEIAAHRAYERKPIIVFRALPPTVHLGHLLSNPDALGPSHPPKISPTRRTCWLLPLRRTYTPQSVSGALWQYAQE